MRLSLPGPAHVTAAADDIICMLPALELPAVLHGLPSVSTVLDQELKMLVQDVIIDAGEDAWDLFEDGRCQSLQLT
jgi:hypothetical protein